MVKNSSDKASISTNPLQSLKKAKPSEKKMGRQEEKLYEKIKLVEGQTSYIL